MVYVSNSFGEGQRSPRSEEYCTAPSCGDGTLCDQEAGYYAVLLAILLLLLFLLLILILPFHFLSSFLSSSLSPPLIIALPPAVVLSPPLIAGIAVASVVVFAVVVALLACFALRQYKKSSLHRSMDVTNYYTDGSASKR